MKIRRVESVYKPSTQLKHDRNREKQNKESFDKVLKDKKKKR